MAQITRRPHKNQHTESGHRATILMHIINLYHTSYCFISFRWHCSNSTMYTKYTRHNEISSVDQGCLIKRRMDEVQFTTINNFHVIKHRYNPFNTSICIHLYLISRFYPFAISVNIVQHKTC